MEAQDSGKEILEDDSRRTFKITPLKEKDIHTEKKQKTLAEVEAELFEEQLR